MKKLVLLFLLLFFTTACSANKSYTCKLESDSVSQTIILTATNDKVTSYQALITYDLTELGLDATTVDSFVESYQSAYQAEGLIIDISYDDSNQTITIDYDSKDNPNDEDNEFDLGLDSDTSLATIIESLENSGMTCN